MTFGLGSALGLATGLAASSGGLPMAAASALALPDWRDFFSGLVPFRDDEEKEEYARLEEGVGPARVRAGKAKWKQDFVRNSTLMQPYSNIIKDVSE